MIQNMKKDVENKILRKTNETMVKLLDAEETAGFKLTTSTDPSSSPFLIFLINILPMLIIVGAAYGFYEGVGLYTDYNITQDEVLDDFNIYIEHMNDVEINQLQGVSSASAEIANQILYDAMKLAFDLITVLFVICLIISPFSKKYENKD